MTYTSIEVINLDLRPKKREEEKEESGLDKLSGSSSIVVCRNCGETGHWTLKCPKRSEIRPFGEKMDEEKGGGGGGLGSGRRLGRRRGQASRRASTCPCTCGQAAQALRRARAAAGAACLSWTTAARLRVTNLSEECTEADLSNLFRRFGHTSPASTWPRTA